MQQAYTQCELDAIVATVSPRMGWNFSSMATRRAAVPWEALADARVFNAILDGNVIDGAFVTNEHRYLAEAVLLA